MPNAFREGLKKASDFLLLSEEGERKRIRKAALRRLAFLPAARAALYCK
jgi:hypothetical protein